MHVALTKKAPYKPSGVRIDKNGIIHNFLRLLLNHGGMGSAPTGTNATP